MFSVYKKIVMLAVILVFTPMVLALPASELLEQGFYLEETTGDLDAAIEIYQQIIQDPAASRTHVASAQYRLGISYGKQGREENAKVAFETLIEVYPDNNEMILLAREQLAKFDDGSQSEGGRGDDKLSFSMVMDDEVLLWSAEVERANLQGGQYDFSPDGERLVFRAARRGGLENRRWNWAHLYISDRTGTVIRPLFPDQGSVLRGLHAARWSPRGDLIAFAAMQADQMDAVSSVEESNHIPWAIFVISPDGGAPRQVGPDFETLTHAELGLLDLSWTPDGTALTRLDENGLHTFDLDGNELRNIPMRPNRNMRLGGYSPDGRWLVYNTQPGNSNGYNSVDIWVLPAEGGRAIRLTHEKGFDGQATWSPVGNSIYFVSTRGGSPSFYGGTTNIWKLEINSETGHPVSAPEQVTFFDDATLLYPKVLDQGAKMAFSLFRTNNAIHVADDASPEESRIVARGRGPQLTADGQQVVYRGEGPGQDDLFVVSVDGGVPRRLTRNTPSQGFEISPDGNTVAYGDVRNDPGIFTVPVTGGERTVLVSSRTAGAPQWSPDGSTLAYTDEKGLYLVAANGGEPREIAHLYDWDSWTVRWSPDGKYIAALGYTDPEMHGVFVVSAEGGEPRMLTAGEQDNYIQALQWHPDSQRIAYSGQGTRIAYLDGRPTTLLVNRPNRLNGFDFTGVWHPNGRRFYFTGFTQGPDAAEWDYYIHDSDMRSDEAVLFEPGGNASPTAGLPHWSGDGEKITWVTHNVTKQLWLMENFR